MACCSALAISVCLSVFLSVAAVVTKRLAKLRQKHSLCESTLVHIHTYIRASVGDKSLTHIDKEKKGMGEILFE